MMWLPCYGTWSKPLNRNSVYASGLRVWGLGLTYLVWLCWAFLERSKGLSQAIVRGIAL